MLLRRSTKGGGKPDLRDGNAGSMLNRSGIREGPVPVANLIRLVREAESRNASVS
jgi:hypothetical protein